MRSLVCLVDLNTVFLELYWVNHESNAVEELPLSCLFEDIGIKKLFVAFGNDIPGFDGPLVAVVERIQPEVFDMPAERGKHHAHIDPRNGDAADFLIVLFRNFENRARRLKHIVEVIKTAGIVKMLIFCSQGLMKRKP